jgi:hypothetical protein
MKQFKLLVALATITLLFQNCNHFSAAGLSSHGQPIKEVQGKLTASPTISSVTLDHSTWDALLKKHVDGNGIVDYKGFEKDRATLTAYLQLLSAQEPTDGWSVQELLAYYINVYNAFTIHAILDHYPVKSIKDISGVWTKGSVPIGDNNLSLAGVENGVLRKMNEPRIHFAINCASLSCPKLLNEAYTAAKIDEQLERATREFINGDNNDLSKSNPTLSSIFDWYAKDFKVKGKEDLIGYINIYSTIEIDEKAELHYKAYNWDLNEQD